MADQIPGFPEPPEINTANDYLISAGKNLPNHSETMKGRGNFVRQSLPLIPTFRTRQEAYRYAAYVVTLAETHLPDEEGCELHTFEEVSKAIRNT
jgi:hypothetical protein